MPTAVLFPVALLRAPGPGMQAARRRGGGARGRRRWRCRSHRARACRGTEVGGGGGGRARPLRRGNAPARLPCALAPCIRRTIAAVRADPVPHAVLGFGHCLAFALGDLSGAGRSPLSRKVRACCAAAGGGIRAAVLVFEAFHRMKCGSPHLRKRRLGRARQNRRRPAKAAAAATSPAERRPQKRRPYCPISAVRHCAIRKPRRARILGRAPAHPPQRLALRRRHAHPGIPEHAQERPRPRACRPLHVARPWPVRAPAVLLDAQQ